MNHTILFIFAFVAIVFAKPPIKGSGTSSEEKAERSSTAQSILSSGPEDVTDSSDITTPAVDVIIQKKEVAIVLAEVPDAKERRSVGDRITQQAEESTEAPESSSPVFVAVVAKKVSPVTAVSSADAKNSSQVKEDGIIVV
ncbi:unnamed protein product [Cylicocyclus nassatus]|uniref:Uncharacterized protein n=1 Tax=Cylicocyclus nassatus TaxID=53992 RepID=A0AA36DQ16_CYLNA|nr:unnamed protein product [Cylicocyclus nassatus]